VIADQHFQVSALPPDATLLRWHDNSQVPLLSSGDGSGTNGEPATQMQVSPGESLAYVMYTSGSTGRPKGVKVPHRAVARLVLNTNYIQIQADDRLAFISSPAFDAATFEIWGALLNGAALVVVAKPVSLDPAALARFIPHQRLTVMFLTTALFNLMASEQPAAFGTLRYLLFGGSAANPTCVSKILSIAAPKQLLHCYGPTETTTFATVQAISRVFLDKRLPIGRPIANSTAYVLNADLQPLPIGAPGEIVLGGDGVGLGYLNRGDRGRFLPDGSIEILGRLDQQVKLRGFRIEPSEVEQALTRQAGVTQAVVLVDTDSVGDGRLVAYLVGDGDQADDARLGRHLQSQLPGYMVPSQWVWLERMPLTANGKVDRDALPKPQTNKASSAFTDQPQTPLEQRLATIWGELLGISQVGRRDNFFELGGQSLKVAQLVSRIRDAFQVSLPIQATFDAPTIAALAPIVEDLVLSQVENLEDGPVEGAS
jgi:acyl-coenzyme A synthetase/AMP-(fatty) acid ligase/acyl carrier protein